MLHEGYAQPRSHAGIQWPFQDPRLEVPSIYKAYVRPIF